MAYPTSDLYKESINNLSRTSYIDGTLTTVTGKKIDITNETISQGSFYITNQCVSSDAFAYGSVFAAETGITLKIEFDRYSLYDAEIILNFNLLLSNGTYEKVPLGKFYVNEPNIVGKNISIKAYDKMIMLEEILDTSTTGTPYDFLVMMSTKFGFELAQTQSEIEALVNGTTLLSAMQDRINTYRDLLSYIACVTCSFAAFDREGKLKLYTYQKSVTKEIDGKIRISSSFSDFETYYSAVTAKFVNNSVYKSYSATEEGGTGLLYDLGEIPVVQGLDETNQAVINNIYEELKQIRYVPCDVTFSGDPSLDLGDMIKCIDRDGQEIISLVTFYKWTYRGNHQLKSAGSNPKLLSVKEKKNNDLANLQSEIESKTVAVYSYLNISEYKIKGGDINNIYSMKEVVTLSFSTNSDTTAIFISTISFSLDTDGIVEFSLYIDNVPQENDVYKQYCQKGENTVTFMTYIGCSTDRATYRCSIFCRTESIISDIRQAKADILTSNNKYNSIIQALSNNSSLPISNITYDTVEPETTVPTATIKKGQSKAVVFGQGLSAKAPWDGTITMFDTVDVVNILSNLKINKPIVEFNVNKQVPIGPTINVAVSSVSITSNLQISGITDTLSMDEVITSYTLDTDKADLYEYDKELISNNGKFAMKTEFLFTSSEQAIDSGKMCSVKIDTSKFASVQSIELR